MMVIEEKEYRKPFPIHPGIPDSIPVLPRTTQALHTHNQRNNHSPKKLKPASDTTLKLLTHNHQKKGRVDVAATSASLDEITQRERES